MTKYSIQKMMRMMASEIVSIADLVPDEMANGFIDEILAVRHHHIYTTGAGRSGLIAKAFAMRLMHIGFESYVVGEIITPAMEKGDLLIAISGSGETSIVAEYCSTARQVGGRVGLITANSDSIVGEMADFIVELKISGLNEPKELPQYEVRQLTGEYRSLFSSYDPLGAVFETGALVFVDAAISALIKERNSLELLDQAE